MLASLLAVAFVPVFSSLVDSVRSWWWTGNAYWFGPATLVGPHGPLSWVVGGLLPAATFAGAIARWSDRPTFRVLIGVWGLAQVAFGGLAMLAWSSARIWDSTVAFPTLELVGFGLAGLAAVIVAAGFVAPQPRQRAAIAAVVAIALTVVVHAPSVVRSVVDSFQQNLQRFELRFVAATPAPRPALLDPELSWVEAHEQFFVLDRQDEFVITEADVRRVRWEPARDGAPAITIMLSRDAAALMRRRSKRRLEGFDAWELDGELIGVPNFRDVLLTGDIHFSAGEENPTGVRDLYHRLTGLDAPP